MKIRREKTIALFVGACMVLTLCMTGFVTTADAAAQYQDTRYISQDGWEFHDITIPEGPDVKIELIWDEPMYDVVDLDFFVPGYGWIGGSMNNPEIAYLSDITVPMDLVVVVNGYYVPGDGVEYTLKVTSGTDVIPEPYARPGGLTVGDLTSWHHGARHGLYSASYKSGHSYVVGSNMWRQTIMPWFSWKAGWGPDWVGVYWGSGWVGPTFNAGDPLLVGGLTYSWSMDDFTIKEARADLATYTIEYKVDGIPLEDLGHVTKDPIRADNVRGQWYWRLPTIIFKPGELYEVLDQTEDNLHTFEYLLNGVQEFFGYFYLL